MIEKIAYKDRGFLENNQVLQSKITFCLRVSFLGIELK
jgi:hypothetical protein